MHNGGSPLAFLFWWTTLYQYDHEEELKIAHAQFVHLFAVDGSPCVLCYSFSLFVLIPDILTLIMMKALLVNAAVTPSRCHAKARNTAGISDPLRFRSASPNIQNCWV
jgi:hypothetical protein